MQQVKLSDLLECEDFIQREKVLQEELRRELSELLQKGYYIPQLKWNPNELRSDAKKEEKNVPDTQHSGIKA